MARIGKVSEREAGSFGRFAYRLSRRRFGEVAEPLTVMAYHPKLLLGYGMMELAFERSDLVDEHLKTLAVLKAATMVGCEFCIDIGSALSRTEGVTEEQLRELPNFDTLREHFSEAQLVELTAAIALENYRARFNHAFGMGSQGFSEGSFCAVPETLAVTTSGGDRL